MEHETTVLVVGAGPAGMAASACLNLQNIPNIVLEREDCYASLWKKRAYDRLRLHLAKQFCELPYMPFPPNTPTFVPKSGFIQYLDNYASYLKIDPVYNREVLSATFDGKWVVLAKDTLSGTTEKYVAKFLVVATGENSQGFIPQIPGLDSFKGEVLHSLGYTNGKKFEKKNVLVVGCGNSGMEIAFDLSNWGANTCIVIRSPMHVLTDDIVKLGMELLANELPVDTVDNIVVMLGKTKYGDLTQYGIQRPRNGPFYIKNTTGRSAVIDVGTIGKIQANEIKVVPSVKKVEGNHVHFENGEVKSFDAIVFATGFRSTVRKWLKDDGGLFNEDGMPKRESPKNWKGDKRIYCTGFARAGLLGISNDAKNLAHDIVATLKHED